MAARKTHDLMVASREYQNNQGETKKEWTNIGARIEWDDGGASLMLKRHINLAGFPGDGDVRVSMFEPKPREGQAPSPAPQSAVRTPANNAALADAAAAFDDLDSIPF
jgi:hypothetical protein